MARPKPDVIAHPRAAAASSPPGDVRVCARAAGQFQLFVVASATQADGPPGAAASAYAQIAATLQASDAAVVHERVFGSLAAESSVMAARRVALSARGLSADGPVTYIQGCPPFGEGFAGATLHAVVCARAGDEVWPIVDGGAACGRGWRHCGVTYLTLQNIANLTSGPAGVSSRATQARGMFERADRILRQHGARYRDVVRTWIYLDEILGWYDEFNQVRNAAYREFGLLPGRDEPPLLPASTGIGGQTPSGAAATMDLLAVVSDQDTRPMMARLPSPLQHDAFRYGSAFSRGAVIRAPDATLVQVSGTAAIDEVGRSCHQGDIRAQIDRTLDTIAALLDGEGATLQDVCAATAFVKRREHAPVFWEMVARRGLQDLPVVCVLGDVCRDELLFEMDAEAAPGSRKVQ